MIYNIKDKKSNFAATVQVCNVYTCYIWASSICMCKYINATFDCFCFLSNGKVDFVETGFHWTDNIYGFYIKLYLLPCYNCSFTWKKYTNKGHGNNSKGTNICWYTHADLKADKNRLNITVNII